MLGVEEVLRWQAAWFAGSVKVEDSPLIIHFGLCVTEVLGVYLGVSR